MELLFWLAVGFVAYVYAGYPVLLGVWAAMVQRREDGPGVDAEAALPGVTVVLAARNEAHRLPARIQNLLELDYPQDRLQIVVASDGSTDGPAVALASFAARVELIELPPSGKAGALNAAVARARHPILVFADARQRFARDAVRRLVRHFANPRIGAVSGELILDCERDASGSTIGDGVGAYWKYEKWLRRREAIVGSTLGVTGAIYAMRRAAWRPLPPDTILDDVLAPMRAVLTGYRVVFDGTAMAFDQASPDVAAETRRKVRTLAGNFQLLALEPRLLLPMVNPVWLQFMSHKIGRLFVPYALMALLVSSAVLAFDSPFYAAALAAQLGFYALAAFGAHLERRERARPAARAGVMREAA